ncbi:aspartate kinase [[Eubacterium] cellulosolvens]
MKFGGESISNGSELKKAADIIKSHLKHGDKLIIIVSAFNAVTDDLVEIVEKAAQGDKRTIDTYLQHFKTQHSMIIQNSIKDSATRQSANEKLDHITLELKNILYGVASIRELTPRSRDYTLSFGEKTATSIMADLLKDYDLRVKYFEGGEIGILTDDNFGEARPLMEITEHEIQRRLTGLDEETVPIITGFIAQAQDGSTTTLGRGGADLTATLVGKSIEADEVWIWSHVDGLMTADPKIVSSAQPLLQASFQEAREMAYFGAKVIHPMALEPAREKNMPIRIKNLHEPNQQGTLIGKGLPEKEKGVVQALALIRDVSLLTISGAGMAGAPGSAAKIFNVLGSNRINVLMISQGSSEANISLVIPIKDLYQALNKLELHLLGNGYVQEITHEADICIIAAIGTGMKGTPGVAARIFKAVADAGVNVRMIAQGSSELNISFVLKEADGVKAMEALHKEFRLDSRKNRGL